MNFFITGAEGFIGSHLVDYLIKNNHKVKAMILYNSFNNLGWLESYKHKNKNLTIFLGDIKDPKSYSDFIEKNDVVINLAALIAIPYSYRASQSYIDTNICGLNNLLEICRKKKPKQIIQISSSEVYGSAQYVPINENHPINPQSPYAATKASADNLALSYFFSFELPISIIRPFNTFGPRQSMRAIIPSIICQYLVDGDINIGHIHTTRSFNYIDDTIRGIFSAVGNKKSIGKIINIGNDYEILISDIVKLTSNIFNKKKRIKFQKDRLRPKKSEVQNLSCDYSLANEILNWSPKIVDQKSFSIFLTKTANWYKKKENFDNIYSTKFVY